MFFFTDIFKSIFWLYILIIIFSLFLLSAINFNLRKISKRAIKSLFVSLLIVVLSFSIFSFNYVANPYVNTFNEGLNYLKYGSLNLNFEKKDYNNIIFDKGIDNYYYLNNSNLENEIILVFVLEGVSLNYFEDEVSKIETNKNYFLKTKDNSHVYTNYYTTNQDSRTAFWTLLTSTFIPYESYIGDWNKYYGFVLEENNLVDFFNYNNYLTYGASSAYSDSLIFKAYNWSDFVVLEDFDLKNEEFLCFHDFEFQKACEDRIILENIENLILENRDENIFLMQEFIFGHGTSYEKTKGVSRVRYYNDYLFDLYSFLEENNLSSKLTIVVISDHGEKGYVNRNLENYNIPLIIYNEKLEYEEFNSLYSHLDFKDILFYTLNLSNNKPVENEIVYFIGQTRSNEVGFVLKDYQYLIGINRDKSKTFFIREKSFNLTNQSINYNLQNFVNYKKDLTILHNNSNFYCKLCS